MTWNMNDLQNTIWKNKYQYNDESFDEWLDRVSNNNKELRQLILDKKFIFGGRILANRGLHKYGKRVTYSNCYVLPRPKDCIESIFDTSRDLARTFSYGGGVGIDISNLSPHGSKINNTAENTTGSVSFMELYDTTTSLIGQKGRRGALMISLDVNHPDVELFIDKKTDLDAITKANISIRVDNNFMNKATGIDPNPMYTCSFYRPETKETIKKEIDAKELFDKLCKNNWDYAEPGVLFWDQIENYNLLSEDSNFEYAGVNPCLVGDTLIQTTEGEIPIKELVGTQPYVYCMDESGKLIIKQASKVWLTRKNAELIKIKHHRGELVCTPDHLIYTINRGWVEAKNLKPKDQLNGLGRSMKDEKHCCVKLTSDKKYHAEHRFIAQYFEDIKGKDVHHINDNPLDNRWENLEVLNHSTHSIITNNGHEDWNKRDAFGKFLKVDKKKKREQLEINKKVNGKNFKVISIEYLNYTEDVYDMTVPEIHNFVANSIIVHNCAEEPLPAGGSCLLGSFNLAAYVKNKKFDYESFENDIPIVVKAMNEVLDEGLPLHPLQIQRDTVRDYRQIGIGIMGLADMLIKMEVRYGSKEAENINDKIGFKLANKAIESSSLLAKEFGSYPKYNNNILKSEFINSNTTSNTRKLVEQYGLRNSQVLTIAPTGSISTMWGISGGIEPIFAYSYTRKTESLHDKEVYYKVYTPIVEDYMKNNNIENEENLPNFFTCSSMLSPDERINMQAIWQKHIDASISSTVNLPNDATVNQVKELYTLAWSKGLKGLTIFRDGCARIGVLTTDNSEDHKEELKRGDWKPLAEDTIYIKKPITIGCGKLKLFIGYSPSEQTIQDLYIKKSGSGGCAKNLETTVIGISAALRLGGNIENIEKAFSGVDACPSFASARAKGIKLSKGSYCGSAILNSVKDFLKTKNIYIVNNSSDENTNNDNIIENKALCPECNSEISMIEGCMTCPSCGYSKCN